MRKILFSITLLSALFLGSCIKNDPVVVTNPLAEIDGADWNTNAVGLTYPITGRNIGLSNNRAAAASDSTIRRYAQVVRVRVNLVGAQSSQNQTVGYDVFNSPVTTFSFPATANFGITPVTAATQVPQVAGAALTISNAVPGTHYTALSGTVTIPPNSSFGYIDISILPTAPAAGEGRFIGLKLNNNGSIKPSVNYSTIGLVIDQR